MLWAVPVLPQPALDDRLLPLPGSDHGRRVVGVWASQIKMMCRVLDHNGDEWWRRRFKHTADRPRVKVAVTTTFQTLKRVHFIPKNRQESHSLTHCCSWPANGRSDLHNERSRVANWQALMGRPISSSTCWSQVLRGQPSGRFQSVAGGVPVGDGINGQMWWKKESTTAKLFMEQSSEV